MVSFCLIKGHGSDGYGGLREEEEGKGSVGDREGKERGEAWPLPRVTACCLHVYPGGGGGCGFKGDGGGGCGSF